MICGIYSNQTSKFWFVKIAARIVLILSVGALAAKVLSQNLWDTKISLFHTAFELLCIFIALSSFLIIWFTYPESSNSNRIVGFGFLAVAVYDIYHTYYFPTLSLYPEGYYDLSTRFWIAGRLCEAVVLLLSASGWIKVNFQKFIAVCMALIPTFTISTALIYFQGSIPVLLDENGVTPPKITLEYFIIALFILSFSYMIKRISIKSTLSYEYICMAILIAIPAELCFTMIRSLDSFTIVYGHVLKVVYYYYLLRGIFVSAVIYPYAAVVRTKDKLREAKHELRDILNGLPLAVVKYDNKRCITFANRKACELLEGTSEQLVGKTIDQIKDKLCGTNKTFDLVFKNQTGTINIIDEYRTFKNNEISLNVNAFNYKSGVLVSFSDAKKDQELSELKIQTRTILNAISNNVIITDSELSIIMFNKAFKICIEMRDSDILGKKLNNLYNELQLTVGGIPYRAKVDLEKNEKAIEAVLVTPRGNKKVILLSYNSIFNVKDEVIGYIFVSSDITEMKKEQQKALRQEKLAIVGQMGSGIVHETKNHLAAIKGYCQLLEKKLAEEQLLKYIDRIEMISEDMNRVIIDFLSLAKPSDTVMDVISLNETIEAIRYMVESPSFVRRVEVNISLTGQDRDIRGDEVQIKQVILNMAKNAIEAMSETKEPVLSIITEACDEQKKMRLIISDNGKGISKENMTNIGSLFFTTKENGTGIGLNLCYRIIEEHKGRIEVQSEEGKGTTFIVSLPYYGEEES